jgi:hypothetical protein
LSVGCKKFNRSGGAMLGVVGPSPNTSISLSTCLQQHHCFNILQACSSRSKSKQSFVIIRHVLVSSPPCILMACSCKSTMLF